VRMGSTSAPRYMFKVITLTRPGAWEVDGSSPAAAGNRKVACSNATSISAKPVDFQKCIASSLTQQSVRFKE
jgi:hypothetical protein